MPELSGPTDTGPSDTGPSDTEGLKPPDRGARGLVPGSCGYPGVMTDYSEQGAVPVDDASVIDPPTVDEVAERQRREYPEQAATARRPFPPNAPLRGDRGGA